MKLCKFDGKRVRVTTVWGDVFDGVCSHNSADYNEHEFGVAEEGLQLCSLLLYKSQIKRVELLKNGFPTPFGKLEELAVEDGVDIIEEIFLSEDDDHILRLLRCLEQHVASGKPLSEQKEICELTLQLRENTKNFQIREAAERLLAKL